VEERCCDGSFLLQLLASCPRITLGLVETHWTLGQWEWKDGNVQGAARETGFEEFNQG